MHAFGCIWGSGGDAVFLSGSVRTLCCWRGESLWRMRSMSTSL